MGRSYNPERVIKASGIHTFYIGDPEKDPLVKCFESYCFLHQKTFSESCREMLCSYFVSIGMLSADGHLTDKFEAYREKALASREQQLKTLKEEREKEATT